MKVPEVGENDKPLISVIMTAYNRERYIAEAIESVLRSSYKNLELIICDDASTDDTLFIAQAYEKKDNRIKVYSNKDNIKQFQNRNKAAKYAKGKYIKYLDSDDIIYHHGLETMVFAMEKYPEAGVGFSFFRYNGTLPLPYLVSSYDAYKEHFCKGGFLYEGPTGAIYRKDYFDKIGKFDIEFDVASDYAFNLKAALYKPVVIFQRDLCWWRKHELQEVNLHNSTYKYLNYNISKHYLNHQDCPLNKEEAAIVLKNVRNVTSRKVLSFILTLNFRESNKLLKDCSLSSKDVLTSVIPVGSIKRLKQFVRRG